VPHEKTDPHVVKRLKAILHPSRKPEEIHKLHEDDESTKWFGVARDLTGRPQFEDFGRYATLMSSISPIESTGNRYPQLVSFIGVTNAGKSTLIKMLVNHDIEAATNENRALFPSPVVGSVVNDTLPTSGDVHLYADPATHAEQLPILFADCEGFEGGERVPLGARSRRRAGSDPDKRDPTKNGYVHTRTIEWANTEESKQREYAVTALYPRLLYTFSDCVVFVLRNPKTFQSAVLTKLLEWGVSALEKSINQPALPHCIVALNGTDPAVDEREWDINFATQSLLSSVKTALDYVEGVPRFRELADHWRSLGKHIYSIEDLILRYYSSFKVIRIPSKPRYMTINEQVGKLHGMIKFNCEESFRAKRRARMLTNADELNTYLQSGFDHFTQHLDVPFNFMQISLLRNPIPNDFGGHILQLCATISSQQPNHQPGRVAWIFERLSVMLASCVLLDCARFRKGRVDELFTNYEKFFDWAMGEYLEMHYPCSYVSADGTRQCQVVKARHQAKGHQDEKGIIATGDYQAGVDNDFHNMWKEKLRAAIASIQRDFQYELEQASQTDEVHAIPEERIALDLHIEYINNFFEQVGPASSICSHATCFCCLMDVPEHALPCGHVICTACIKAYGKQNKSSVSVACCPLHRLATKWATPAMIKFKPPGAGVRVLALDGGGIRGVVQLEVLRAIEKALGGYLPIQAFFDLIVGTGTGGVIAVALAMKDRTIDACIDMFSVLCDHAYTPRFSGALPIISHLAQVLGSGPKYKTKPLHGALKTAFTEDDDLFGTTDKLRSGMRVALTSTSVTGRETMLLASYRRPEDFLPAYKFERPHEPEMELKMWEGAAASISHPALFRPFVHHNKTYLDGGIRCPNPAFIADRERRLIWPDVGEPDLFLSLGTGQNRITILQKLSDRPKDGVPDTIIPPAGQTPKKSSGRWRARRIDDVLDAEVQWADFRAYAVKERSEAKGRRFIRFNPDLDKEPPNQDSKHDLENLQANVRKRLQTAHRMAALRNVAHRLVASSFYLELQSKATAEKSEQVCSGNIACRFEDGSSEMAALGKILLDRRTDGFEPFFMIKPDQESSVASFRVAIGIEVVRAMVDSRVFGLANVFIPLKDEGKATSITLFLSSHDGLEPDGFPISGFPRVLLGEPNPQQKNTRRPVRSSSEQTLRTSNRHLRSPSLDGDNISLNGPAPSTASSEDQWQDTQAKMSQYLNKNGSPKISLADLIAQNQHQEGAGRVRTNRFWTYIGNNHMTQHPELYSEDELSKFAMTASNARPSELPTPMDESHHMSGALSTVIENGQPQELEADDKATREMHQQQYYAAARDHARSSQYSAISSSGMSSTNSTYNSSNTNNTYNSSNTSVVNSPPSRTSSLQSSQYQLSAQVYKPNGDRGSNSSGGPPGPGQSRNLSHNPLPRDAIPSVCETEFDDDDELDAADRGTYSSHGGSSASNGTHSNDEVRRPTSSSTITSVVSAASTSIPMSLSRRVSAIAAASASPPLYSPPLSPSLSPPLSPPAAAAAAPAAVAPAVVAAAAVAALVETANPPPPENSREVVSPIPFGSPRESIRDVVSPIPPEEQHQQQEPQQETQHQRNASFDSVLSYYDSPRLT
jgi:predicted acylesterase/phospholipase RssA